ncbi:MAG: hypothetical protein ACT4OW_03635 [Nitrososphaerota archaeon]
MGDSEIYRFNNIINEIIKKSLFTERQIEIILRHKNLIEFKLSISKGAYYRQVNQSREKLLRFYYSIILLRGLGIVLPDDIDMISQLSEKISVIKDGDVFPERELEIIDVIDRMVRQLSKV